MKFLLFVTLLATTIVTSTQASVFSAPLPFKKMADPNDPLVNWGGRYTTFQGSTQPSVGIHWGTFLETNVVKFEIQRYHSTTGWQFLTFVNAGVFTYGYFDMGILPGETYQYRIAAVNAFGTRTPWTDPLTITIPYEW